MSSATGRDQDRVTIAEVARQAGVSAPTVSKVLNGRDDVAPETRTRVSEVIASTGYRARRPRRRDQRGAGVLIDLVITELTSAYAMEVLAGAEAAAARAGAGLVVHAAHDNAGHDNAGHDYAVDDHTVHGRAVHDRASHDRGARDRSWLGALRSRQPAGVVLVVNRFGGGSLADVAALGAPVVLLDPAGSSDPSLPTVGATNFAGGVAATQHLLGLGHRRIAAITGLPFLVCSQERVEGYRAAMARAGVMVRESLVQPGDFTAAGGQRAAAVLLERPDPPTAIFAGSDLMAAGVLQEARRRGLDVPGDVSVVGFDDVAMCQYLSPPLTTVRQPLGQMAGEAVRLVLADVVAGRFGAVSRPGRADSPQGNVPHVQLATRLVVRESTAALHVR